MDFGKLADVSAVDFSLPSVTERTWRNLRLLARGAPPDEARSRTRAFWGAPVWSRKEWIGKLYPAGARPADFLDHYARQLTAIELNTSFYRIPDAATIDHWRRITPEGFRFCPKFHQSVTHGEGLLRARVGSDEFCESALLLGPRLGLSFLQLPPGFSPSSAGILDRFLGSLPPDLPVAVEFRHPAWFIRGALRDEACDILEARGASTVITDVAGRRDVSHGSLTSGRVLVRFIGNSTQGGGVHPTDRARLDAWAERIRQWADAGLEEIHFFVHEPEDAMAPDVISEFLARVNRACGWSLPDWKPQGEQLQLLG